MQRRPKHFPTPLGPLLTVLPIIGGLSAAFFTLRFLIRSVAPKPKLISKYKCLEGLKACYHAWGMGIQRSSQQEQQILEANPNLSQEERKAVVEHVRSQLIRQLRQAEEEIMTGLGITKYQFREACEQYSSDPTISKFLGELNKLVATAVPPPPLPHGWTESKVLNLLSELFDLRLQTMEDAYKALNIGDRPAGTPLTPQMSADLNATFNETLGRRIEVLYKERGVNGPLVQRLTRAVSNSPLYVELVGNYREEQTQRYAALGLQIRKN